MKPIFIYTLLLVNFTLMSCAIFAQLNPHANTYAVVVGISKYSNAGIKSLRFANRDAQVFSNYLQSNAGGLVPTENIRLLIDSNATCAAIYDALTWLLETCEKNDLVYFYFAGHGDMENNTIYKLGFLLSYNTPRNNYINNAVRIEDLNNIANTLSVKTQAHVILITDACHSGKLAGSDYRGTFLVGDQLRTVRDNEIRITACAPDQLSSEDEGWGGGRGIFSYYLVNGLTGLADNGQDGIITKGEIQHYLDSSFSRDAILKQNNLKQNPVLKGVDNFPLAKVDTNELTSLKRSIKLSKAIAVNTTALPVQAQDYFFKLLKKENIESIDFNELNSSTTEKLPFLLINKVRYKSLPPGADTAEFNSQRIDVQFEKLEKKLENDPDAVKKFNNKLVEVLHDKGQEIINLYLAGDAAEMEKRRYYNAENNGYDNYIKMFALALKLTDPENFLHRILEVNFHYFKGVAARLKIPTVEDPAPLLKEAMSEQKIAMQLEENAAYIHNELGNLYFSKAEFSTAEKYFLRATQIAPDWVIPWSNLILLHGAMKNYEKAISAFERSKELQPGFQGTYVNGGMVYERKGNLLQAEELFRKGITMNSRHFLPFERLGYVYMAYTNYAMADSFFYEADLRKRGYHFRKSEEDPIWWVAPASVNVDLPCDFDSADIRKDDIIGNFTWALITYKKQNLPLAEKKFRYVLTLDRTNPLAFHYLGKLLYEQNRWAEADIMFNLAVKSFLDTTAFNHYCDSVSGLMTFTASKECLVKEFKKSQYEKKQDHYFLASLYEKWNHFAEAEKEYRIIINMEPDFIGGYSRLWNMLENIGRYDDAKDIILGYRSVNPGGGDNELNAFYERMVTRFPENGHYFYEAGRFLYYIAATRGEEYPNDHKEILPDETEEKYISAAKVKADGSQVIHTISLPGTMEQISGAKKIYIPRSNGIDYLLKADSLLSNDEDALTDINQKLGDLYVWIGLTVKANRHYQRSVDMQPNNAGTRLKLTDTYAETYQLHAAFTQLDSLYNRGEINLEKQIMYARYNIHAGLFDKGGKLLEEAAKVLPYKIPEITELMGRKALMSHNPGPALAYYKEFLSGNGNDPITTYTIARIYAQKGNDAEAWNWLEKAMDKGFRYPYILEFDKSWKKFRGSAKWKALVKRFPLKEYQFDQVAGN